MARKKIGLFMSEITQFFQASCGKAVIDLASLRDADVIIFASFGSYSSPYGRSLLSEIAKKNIIYLPDFSKLDAVIALPNSFDIQGMDKEFFDLVRANAACPVICLQSGPEDFYTISVENKETMYSMTRHFIDEHHFTDICYMSGPFDHKDSPARLEGFKSAMQESGLVIGENSIYEGNYWMNRGADAMDFFMKGRINYPQAIICANDYMAISITEELRSRGQRVPQDVCVCGFDGIREGEYARPSLTTVSFRPERFAEVAFEILDDIESGKTPAREHTVPSEFIFRASCGCGCQVLSGNIGETYRRLTYKENLLRESGRISSDYQSAPDLDSVLSVANYYFRTLGCSTGYFCYCDENDPKFFSVEQEFPFTDKMHLLQVMNADRRQRAEYANEFFDRRDILPERFFDTEDPCAYIVLPLFYKNKIYGYLVLKPETDEWPNESAYNYISTLSSAIENCYYQKQFGEFADIKKMSRTDELTGLYNRRGFEHELQKLLSRGTDGRIINLVSIDMDNLKMINDVHGHAEGDEAIRKLAEILSGCLEGDDFCARFGGDEFTAVLVSDEPGRADEFAARLRQLTAQASDEPGRPYELRASIGTSLLRGRDTNDIVSSMKEADDRMYQDKREHKQGGT